MLESKLKQIHDLCGWHEKEIKNSNKCGCFNCLSIFLPSEIKEWIEESKDYPRGPGKTAVCPKCDIDTVLPENDLYKINNELLETMHDYWCNYE